MTERIILVLFFLFVLVSCVFAELEFRLVGVFMPGDSVTAIELDDTIMYISDGAGGFLIVNIAEPTAPLLLSAGPDYYEPGCCYASDLFLLGDTLLLADHLLSRFDISDPRTPVLIDTLRLTWGVYSATNWGDTVALGGWEFWAIVDFSDMAAPVILSETPSSGVVYDVAKAGDILVVEENLVRGVRLQLFNVAVPTAPVLVSTWESDTIPVWGVHTINDTLLFLGEGILNIANPATPVLLSVVPGLPYSPPGGDWCTILNDTAYVAHSNWYGDSVADLFVVDLTDPLTPFVIGECVLPEWEGASAVAVRNDTIFLGYYDIGLSPGVVILACETSGISGCTFLPSSLVLSVYPNPFNSSVKIDAPAGSTIEIYNIKGEKIAVVPADKSGLHQWTPDKPIGSGVYLIHSKIGDKSLTKRVVYLK